MTKQLPAELNQIYINVTGTDFPENIRAELPPTFSSVITNRESSTSVEITAVFDGSQQKAGTLLPMTLTAGRFQYVVNGAFEVIDIQPLAITGVSPPTIVANGVNNNFTITGTGFNTPSVSISGTGVTFTETGESVTTTITGTINASIGATPGNRNLSVTVGGDTVTLTDGLVITAPITPIDVTNVSPSTLQQGTTQNYTLTGNSFVTGAVASVSGADVTVNSTTFISSTELTANITVGGAAALTQRNLTVTNTDTSNDTLTNAFTVVEASTSIRIEQPTALEGLVVQGDAINFTPTLISGDTGGTWASTALPTGASLNASTGEITGTLSTLGKNFIYLTYTEGGESDTALFVIHVVDQIATIAGQSISSPINLNVVNRAWRLLGNITAARTAFIATQVDQLLDLNGFAINYDNEAEIPNFPNPDFAGGSTTGWDLSGASEAEAMQGTLAARTAYDDNEYALRMSVDAGSPKTIVTTDSFSFVADEWYAITYWNTEIAVGGSIVITFTIGSNNTGTLTSGEDSQDQNGWRAGTFGYYIFKANATETVPVSVTITCSSGTKTTYLSKLDLKRCWCHGIVTGNVDNANQFPNGYGGATGRLTVCNGSLTQVNRTPFSNSVYCTFEPYLDSLTVTNRCRVTSAIGKLTVAAPIDGMYVTNCVLASEAIGINNRDNSHGWMFTVLSSAGGGSYVFKDNEITKTIQGGFQPTALVGHVRNSLLSYNVMNMQQRYTNGFGIAASGAAGQISECKNNTMDLTAGATDQGRGIRVGNYATMRNNNLTVRSLPRNQEYAGFTLGGAYAMQLEDTGISCNFYNETYSVVGPGGGGAFRINGKVQTPIDVHDCTFEIDSSVVSPPYTASCLKLSDPGSPSMDLAQFSVERCTLKTNQILIESIGANIINTMTLTDCAIHIVQDGNYGSNLFDISNGLFVFVNPTYFDSTSQTLFEAAVAADARVSIA